jgi:hypothetical protein
VKLRIDFFFGCRTWKQDCKAEIIVGLTKERNRLVINKLVEEHNHDIPST